MAGLGSPMQQAPAPEQQAPGMAPAGMAGEDGMEGGEPATPEEEALYEKFVTAALDAIYPADKGEPSPQIVDDLKGNLDPKVASMFKNADPPLGQSPLEMVSAVSVVLTIMIDENLGMSATKAQGGAPRAREDDMGGEEAPGMEDDGAQEYGADTDSILMHAGKAIFEELVEVAEAANIHDFTEPEMESAWYRAMDLYRTAAETIGKTGYDAEALKAEFGALSEASNNGTLGSILPGLPGGSPMQEGA